MIVSFTPSTTRYPLGRTLVTRAVRVAVRMLSRLVAPCPSSEVELETLARSARRAFAGPNAEVMPALTPDCRELLVLPLAAAEARSETRIVIRSSIWLARKSRATSPSGAEGLHSDPAEAPP